MKQIIYCLSFCLALSACSDTKQFIRQTSLRKLAEERMELGNGYTCDKDNYELFMNEAHKKRKRCSERTGQNMCLNDAVNQLCKELDNSVFSRKDKHISFYELDLVNNKNFETPLWGVE